MDTRYLILFTLIFCFLNPVFSQSAGISPPSREINLTIGESGYVSYTVMQSSDELWETGYVDENIEWMQVNGEESFPLKSCVYDPTHCHYKLNFTVSPFYETGIHTASGTVSVGSEQGGAMNVFASVRFDITVNVFDCFNDNDCPSKTCEGDTKKEYKCENHNCQLYTELCDSCQDGMCIPKSCSVQADCGDSYCEGNVFRFFQCIDSECRTFTNTCSNGCGDYNGCYGDCSSNSDCPQNWECLNSEVLRMYECQEYYCTTHDIQCSYGCSGGDCNSAPSNNPSEENGDTGGSDLPIIFPASNDSSSSDIEPPDNSTDNEPSENNHPQENNEPQEDNEPQENNDLLENNEQSDSINQESNINQNESGVSVVLPPISESAIITGFVNFITEKPAEFIVIFFSIVISILVLFILNWKFAVIQKLKDVILTKYRKS